MGDSPTNNEREYGETLAAAALTAAEIDAIVDDFVRAMVAVTEGLGDVAELKAGMRHRLHNLIPLQRAIDATNRTTAPANLGEIFRRFGDAQIRFLQTREARPDDSGEQQE
jgi:hypothetical protein